MQEIAFQIFASKICNEISDAFWPFTDRSCKCLPLKVPAWDKVVESVCTWCPAMKYFGITIGKLIVQDVIKVISSSDINFKKYRHMLNKLL
jgi:hypothetical protein